MAGLEHAKLAQNFEFLTFMTLKSKILIPVFAFILCFLALQSCKNDIDINANWKEIFIIYGALNTNDTVQYVRVEKAYLDPKTGALQVAQIADSLQIDSAIVTLSSWAGVDTMKRIFYVPKEPGIFANDKNPLYKTNKKIDSSKSYTIQVHNPKTGTKATASTNIVWPAVISSPVRNSNSKFSCQTEFINITFVPKNNSFAYDIKLTVYYDEFLKTDTFTKISKVIHWNMVTNQPVQAGVETRVLIPRLAFLQFLSSSIAADITLNHRLKKVDMTWYGGSQTIIDYISVNQPSIGIIQKTAEYTNITGGYGIFGSRCIQAVKNVRIDPVSVILIANHVETVKLNIIP